MAIFFVFLFIRLLSALWESVENNRKVVKSMGWRNNRFDHTASVFQNTIGVKKIGILVIF
jgi:hypothetical protein